MFQFSDNFTSLLPASARMCPPVYRGVWCTSPQINNSKLCRLRQISKGKFKSVKVCIAENCLCRLCTRYIITINVPLIKKLRDIIFFCGTITLWAISRDILRGAKTFLRGQKSRGPLKISREMAHKVLVPQKKIRSQSFLTLIKMALWAPRCRMA